MANDDQQFTIFDFCFKHLHICWDTHRRGIFFGSDLDFLMRSRLCFWWDLDLPGLLRLRVTQKALQLTLFSSFSLQPIWSDLQKLLAKFYTFVKLDECGLIQTYWKTLCDKYLLLFEISCMKTSHAMCFRENNNGGSKRANKWACECYQYFSWCWQLLKVSNVFHSKNLALFMVASIHSIWKITKFRNWKLRNKMKGNRKYKAQTDQKTDKLNW